MVEVKRKDEIGMLGALLNTMIASWRSIVKQLVEGTANLSSSSAEIAASAKQMSDGAQSQMEQIARTSSGVEQMSVSIQEVSMNAKATSAKAEASSARASTGAERIKEAVEGTCKAAQSMEQLNKRMEKVGKVVEIIKGIAAQTNILSMNAAIEAARAGEHGRGFDVVSREIRTLALRTSESTDEVAQILNDIQTGTDSAVSAMTETADLVELADRLQEITDMFTLQEIA